MANSTSYRVMPNPRTSTPIVREDALVCADDDVSDGQLLTAFIGYQDESAFAELVRRHARMVLGVCQRVLDNRHDAEDCFQAAFLVLVRKATTIQPREMVGNWLYGVAYRTALEAKKMAARRRNRERKKFDMPREETDWARWQELRPLLDEEMSRLPERYRFVLIACDLEGRTRKDVARTLEVPEGTVASRLSRARRLLAKRLNRHNLAISAPALAALLTDKASAAFVPEELVASTTRAAAHLAAGNPVAGLVSGQVAALVHAALKSMLMLKLKIATTVLVALAILGIGVGALLPPASAERKPADQKSAVAPKPTKPRSVNDCIIENIDPETLVMQAAELNAEENGGTALRDYRIEPDAKIIIDGHDAKLADLKLGDCVNIQYRLGADGNRQAIRIEAVGETLAGVVEAINVEAVTISSDNGDKVKKTCKLDPGVRVFVNGKKAKLGDVAPKMPVNVRVPAGKPAAVSIVATAPKAAGVTKALNVKERNLTVETRDIKIVPNAAVPTATGGACDGLPGVCLSLVRAVNGIAATFQLSAHGENVAVGIQASKK